MMGIIFINTLLNVFMLFAFTRVSVKQEPLVERRAIAD
jgi:hypothetical protein